MDISLSGVATSPTVESETSSGELDQSTFLNLLTTQLQYQDPMDPQSSEEFVAQLAQFSSLEQMVATNESLAMLNVLTSSLNNASMTQLLGKSVVAYSDGFDYSGEGDVSLQYDAQGVADQVTVTVYDEDGLVVHSEDIGPADVGEGSYSWDGTDLDGQPLEEGSYTFTFTGTDSDGNEVAIEEMIEGTIDGMSFETGTATPSIGEVSFDLSAIYRVNEPQ